MERLSDDDLSVCVDLNEGNTSPVSVESAKEMQVDELLHSITDQSRVMRFQIESLKSILGDISVKEEMHRTLAESTCDEIALLQNVLSSLTVQLRKDGPENQTAINDNGESSCAEGSEFLLSQPPVDQYLYDETFTSDTGQVTWSSSWVNLFSPSIEQCHKVATELQTVNCFKVELCQSTTDIALAFLSQLNVAAIGVMELEIRYTSISEECLHELVKNARLESLHLSNTCLSSSGLEIITRSNMSLENLVLAEDESFDEEKRVDVKSLGKLLAVNSTIKKLALNGIMDNHGVQDIAKSLKFNKTLAILDLSLNSAITSTGAGYLSDMLKVNSSLTKLNLHWSSITTDGIKLLLRSLIINTTLKHLGLDKQHQHTCEQFSHYKLICDRLHFE